MKICPKCKKQYESGNFCEDCENEDGSPVKLEEEKITCPQCGRQYNKGTKFCSECGIRLGAAGNTGAAHGGLSMGDKNVIAGDVNSSVTTNNNTTSTTYVNNTDETKKVIKCHACGGYIQLTDGYECPQCHLFTCKDCYSKPYRMCLNCAEKAQKAAAEKKAEEERVKAAERDKKAAEQVKELPHDMVFVEGGKLTLGSDDEYNNPKHEVELDSFYISKYEVTQELYERVIGKNPSKFKGSSRPAETMTWYDAVEFCNKLSEKEGLRPCYKIDKNNIDPDNENDYDYIKWTVSCDFKANGYRLPSEAEWEYAARGGQKNKGYEYAGSSNIDEAAWYEGNSGGETHDVGKRKPNELGLYDMTGNIWEWCWDWYGDEIQDGKNPRGAGSGSCRVYRGGCWEFGADFCAVSYRFDEFSPSDGEGNLGFRVVRSAN